MFPGRRLVFAAILGGSILVRIIYFGELNRGPCIWQHRWDQTDMHFFDLWARDIAAGDWLTKTSLYLDFLWKREVAEQYLREHPDEAASLARNAAGAVALDPSRALWDRWQGRQRFRQEPLYPYLVAVTYKLFGPEVRWVFAWQMVLGVLSNLLIYLVARRHFGAVVGTVAGTLAVLYSPLLYYELLLLRESLLVFVSLGIVYLADVAFERGTRRWWLMTGLASGLGILLRASHALLALGVFCWMSYRHRKRPQLFWQSAMAMAAGAALCLIPLLARNAAVGASPLALSSGEVLVGFICFNARDYSPDAGLYASSYVSAIMSKTGGRFFPVLIETLKTHPNVRSYLRQLRGKFYWAWNWYEKPNNANFYYYRLHAPVLHYLPLTFLLVAPLAIVGMALAVPQFHRCAVLYLLVIASLVPLLLFTVLSRYRLPLAVAVLPFAGLTLVRIAEWMRKKRVVPILVAFVALVLVSFWTMRPLPADVWLIRPADYIVPYQTYWDAQEQEARAAGDWRRAAEVLRESLRYEPALLRELGPGRPARGGDESDLAFFFGTVHHRYAKALRETGNPAAAEEQEQRALTLLLAAQGRR